jgi:hypothetical protein
VQTRVAARVGTQRQGYVLYVATIACGTLPCLLTAAPDHAALQGPRPLDAQQTAEISDGRVWALLPSDDSATLAAENLTAQGHVLVQRYRADGSLAGTLRVRQQASPNGGKG